MSIPRVYMVGKNPVASLIAHEIARIPDQPRVPQVVLQLNGQKEMDRFLDNDSKLELNKRAVQLMASAQPPRFNNGDISPIDNLIIAGPPNLKSRFYIDGLRRFQECLDSNSNVLFVNSPLNFLDSLQSVEFKSKPKFYQGVSTQMVRKVSEFSTEYKKDIHDALKISPVDHAENDNDFLSLLKDTKLNTTMYSFDELLLLRYETLIIESVVNPLTTLYGCFNGELLQMPNFEKNAARLIREMILVIQAHKPELCMLPQAQSTLNTDRILHVIKIMLHETPTQSSRMLRDVTQGYGVHFDTLNEYLLRLSHDYNVAMPFNRLLVDMVKDKWALEKYRDEHVIRLDA